VDLPWPYEVRDEDPSHRAAVPYPTMSIAEMCALQVPSIMHADSILWMWTTNHHMREAYDVLDAWGFEPKTILTWAKDKMGTGDWLRGQIEHCIMAVRGKPVVTLSNQTTLLHAEVRGHSQKPPEFCDSSSRSARHRTTPTCSAATHTTRSGTATGHRMSARRRPADARTATAANRESSATAMRTI
jgi:N6-adenosine-specific RNA methylase IME4